MKNSTTEHRRKLKAIAKLVKVYRVNYGEDADEVLDGIVEALEDYPANRVERVCKEILKTSKFMPAISDLVDALEMDYANHPTKPKVRRLTKEESIKRLIELDMGEVTRHGTMEEYREYIEDYERESGLTYQPMLISDSDLQYAKRKGFYPQ